MDEPKPNSEYIYNYRDGSGIKYKGTPFNTAGWTTVEVTGKIIEKIGPILATKYGEFKSFICSLENILKELSLILGAIIFQGFVLIVNYVKQITFFL